jgi:hypothetical protein
MFDGMPGINAMACVEAEHQAVRKPAAYKENVFAKSIHARIMIGMDIRFELNGIAFVWDARKAQARIAYSGNAARESAQPNGQAR